MYYKRKVYSGAMKDWDLIEELKNKHFLVKRLVLISKSHVFNSMRDVIKTESNNKEKIRLIALYAEELGVPESMLANVKNSDPENILGIDYMDLLMSSNVYYVYDSLEGRKNIVDDGVYIKFDPSITNTEYERVIKKLRSSNEFIFAAESEKEDFIKGGGRKASDFRNDKKSGTPRKHDGYNFEEDIRIYLACEKEIGISFSPELKKGYSRDNDAKVEWSVEEAASKLGIDTHKCKQTYYEVCRRYKIPIHSISVRQRLDKKIKL